MSPETFQLRVTDETLTDLRTRLERTRWPNYDDVESWDAGTSSKYLRELVEYWLTAFDWRAQEAKINQLPQFTAKVDGMEIHFVRERGIGFDAMPIILTHGYPDSFLRFQKLIPLLTNPTAHGGDARDVFDVIVPSMPGYSFSETPKEPDGIFKFGSLWHKLMTEHLGYERYAAHGGDWGATITEFLARDHREAVIGIHLTEVPFFHAFQPPNDLTLREAKFLDDSATLQQREGAYVKIQGTRPQTLADGLNDSPVGLASWLIEKFQTWSDCHGNIESRFTKDELITNVMLYWLTETIGASFLPYYDMTHAGAARWMKEKAKEWLGASNVPTAFALFPKDLTHPPRQWAERFFNVERWTEMPSGGHFAAMEEPQLLAQDIREFYRPFRVIRSAA